MYIAASAVEELTSRTRVGLEAQGVGWWRSSLTPQTVRGAVEVETTGTGRTRWTAGLVETGWRPRRLAGGQVETTASTEPGGVHRSW